MSEVYTTLPPEISLENRVKAPRWEIFLGNQSLEELKIKKLVSKIVYKSDLGKFDTLILTFSIASHSLVDARNIEDAIQPLISFATPVRLYIWDECSYHEGAIHSLFANPKKIVHVGTLKTIKIAADKREATLEYAGLISNLKGDNQVFSEDEDINITYREAIERLVDYPNLTLQLQEGLANYAKMTEVPDAGSTLNQLEGIAQTLGMHMRIKPDPTKETSYILHMGYLSENITRDDWSSVDAKKIMIINPNMTYEQNRKDYIHLATFNPEANFLGQEYDVNVTSTNPVYGSFSQMELWQEPTDEYDVTVTIPYTAVSGLDADADYFNIDTILMGFGTGLSVTRTWQGALVGAGIGAAVMPTFIASPEVERQVTYEYTYTREGSEVATDEEMIAAIGQIVEEVDERFIGFYSMPGAERWQEQYDNIGEQAYPGREIEPGFYGGGEGGDNPYTAGHRNYAQAGHDQINASFISDTLASESYTRGVAFGIMPNQDKNMAVNYQEAQHYEERTGMRSHSYQTGTFVVFEYAGITTCTFLTGAVEDDEAKEMLEAAILNGKMGNFVQAKGCKLVEGNARLEVGTTWGIVVKNMPLFDHTFTSQYYISSVQHTISRGGGFETKFDCGSGYLFIPPATPAPPPIIDDGFPDESDYSNWNWLTTVPFNVAQSMAIPENTLGWQPRDPVWLEYLTIQNWWQGTMGQGERSLFVEDSTLYSRNGLGFEFAGPVHWANFLGTGMDVLAPSPLTGMECGPTIPGQVDGINEYINSMSEQNYLNFLKERIFPLTHGPHNDEDSVFYRSTDPYDADNYYPNEGGHRYYGYE